MTSRELPLDRVADRWRAWRERNPRPLRLARRALVVSAWGSLVACIVALVAVPAARGALAQLVWGQFALWSFFVLARSKSVSWAALGRLFAAGAVVVAPLAGLASVALPALVGGDRADLWALVGWAPLCEEVLKLLPALVIWWGLRRSTSLGVADWGLIGGATGAGFAFCEEALRRLASSQSPAGGLLLPGAFETELAAGRMFAGHAVLTALVLLGVGFWLRGRSGGWLPSLLLVLVIADHAAWNGRAGLPSWVLTAHDVLGGGYLAIPAVVALLVVATLTDTRDVNAVRADVLRLPGEDRLGPAGDLLALLRAAPSGLVALGRTMRLLRARRAAAYALTRSRADAAASPEAIHRAREATVAFGPAAAAAGLVALAVLPLGGGAAVGVLLEPLGEWWGALDPWRRGVLAVAGAGLVGASAGGWSRWLAAEYAGDVGDHTPLEAAALAGGHLLDGLVRRLPPLPHPHRPTLAECDALLEQRGESLAVREAYAEAAYEVFRGGDAKADIAAVAAAARLPADQVRRLRERLFFDVHQLEGRVGRLDPDPDVADAWRRLRAGSGGEADAQVLERRTYTLLLKEAEEDGTVTYRFGPDEQDMGVLRFDPRTQAFEVLEAAGQEDDRRARLKLLRIARHGGPWPRRTTYEG